VCWVFCFKLRITMVYTGWDAPLPRSVIGQSCGGPQAGKAGSVDGAFGRDPLAREVEHFGELVEVMVVVQDPKAALCGGGS
jgi:hypothetical protein